MVANYLQVMGWSSKYGQEIMKRDVLLPQDMFDKSITPLHAKKNSDYHSETRKTLHLSVKTLLSVKDASQCELPTSLWKHFLNVEFFFASP